MFEAVLPATHLDIVASWEGLRDDTFVIKRVVAADFECIDEAGIGASIRLESISKAVRQEREK